jgi:hypothetical protein
LTSEVVVGMKTALLPKALTNAVSVAANETATKRTLRTQHPNVKAAATVAVAKGDKTAAPLKGEATAVAKPVVTLVPKVEAMAIATLPALAVVPRQHRPLHLSPKTKRALPNWPLAKMPPQASPLPPPPRRNVPWPMPPTHANTSAPTVVASTGVAKVAVQATPTKVGPCCGLVRYPLTTATMITRCITSIA